MKIKHRPEDFLVREIDRYDLRGGPYSLYRLEKWDIGTIEAVGNVARKWKIPRDRISFGGLKDRHARTEQVISIRNGPDRDFEGSSFRLKWLGRAREPIGRDSFDANAFTIVVRDLERIPDLEAIRRWGFPNYFDDQRFGSLRGAGGEFIGRCLVRGEFEKALRIAIASPAPEDRRSHREVKTRIRDRWGDWPGLKETLPRTPERSIVAFLADHPGDYARAFERLETNLRILYVSAYQSWLWNRALAERLRSLPETFEVPYTAGRMVFYRSLPDDRLFELSIPLLSPSTSPDEVYSKLLTEEGVELRQFRIKRLEKTFFGRGDRSAIARPARLRAEASPDELHSRRQKWTLSFELPKGSYATVLLKGLFGLTSSARADDRP